MTHFTYIYQTEPPPPPTPPHPHPRPDCAVSGWPGGRRGTCRRAMLYGDEADLDSIHAYQTRDTIGSVVSLIRPKARAVLGRSSAAFLQTESSRVAAWWVLGLLISGNEIWILAMLFSIQFRSSWTCWQRDEHEPMHFLGGWGRGKGGRVGAQGGIIAHYYISWSRSPAPGLGLRAGLSEYTNRRRGFCGYRSTKRYTSNWLTVQVFGKTTYTGASEYTDRRRGFCGYRSTKRYTSNW